MQYIQTSDKSYLFSAITALSEALADNDVEFEFDYARFGELEEKKNYIGQYKCLVSVTDVHKLDKSSKFMSFTSL